MPTVNSAISWAVKELISDNPKDFEEDDAELDAQILLAHSLSVPRSFFYGWPTHTLKDAEYYRFAEFIKRKLKGEPVAYITGEKEFWSLNFIVSPATLIPRPSTEVLVETLFDFMRDRKEVCMADLGTGCGAIAIAAASERPTWEVYATDNSSAALDIARANAKKLKTPNVVFCEGSWCSALPDRKFDVIVSNPPYIAVGDPEVEQSVIDSEPHSALFSGKDGLADLAEIIREARNHLRKNGYLIVEHGYEQAEDVRQLFGRAGYAHIKLFRDGVGYDRVTKGRFRG